MKLKQEQVTKIGSITYHGAEAPDDYAEMVLVTTPPIEKIKFKGVTDAIGLSFACGPAMNALMRVPEDQLDPCDHDYIEANIKKLIATGYLFALGDQMEELFPDIKVVVREGDDETGAWVHSYGYGTFDGRSFQRYLFVHPTCECIDTGPIGAHMRFMHEKEGVRIDLDVYRS